MASLTNTLKHENDFWYTPEPIKEATLSLIPENVKDILDPCAGACDLCDFEKYNYTLLDINPRQDKVKKTDFFDYTENHDCIVMNPPFSIGRDFIEHALQISNTVIVICPFSVVKPFRHLIKAWKGEYWWKNAFCIGFPVASFRLEKPSGFTFGINEDFDYLFGTDSIRPIGSLPKYNGEKTGLAFYPALLGTNHDFNWIDPRTGFTGWCIPLSQISDVERKRLMYYENNTRGHKAGEKRENIYYLDTDEKNYEYFFKCYPENNWYKVTGINNEKMDTFIPDNWEDVWDTEDKSTWARKLWGENVRCIL